MITSLVQKRVANSSHIFTVSTVSPVLYPKHWDTFLYTASPNPATGLQLNIEGIVNTLQSFFYINKNEQKTKQKKQRL